MTSNSTVDPTVIEAAREFLSHSKSRHRTEGNVQSDLEALLRKVGVGSLESHYSSSDGEADIFLPNRRAFLEVKATPLAGDPDRRQGGRSNETPREQLDRYVIGEINRDIGRIPTDDEQFNRSNWQGILTDGQTWHVYEYPHRLQSNGVSIIPPQVFMNEADSDSLAEFLYGLLGERDFGREWIPSEPGDLFTNLKDELVKLFEQLPRKAVQATQTKKDLWLDMMRTSGMVPTDEEGKNRLFVTHSFLIALVRFVSHSLFQNRSGKDWKSALQDGFASWVLEFTRGEKWAWNLYEKVARYDWRSREEDVLRNLYQHIVSEHDRKVFGEFYTPDWLADLMVREVLDDAWLENSIQHAAATLRSGTDIRNIGVLDPTCGSGTFLFHAARRILAAESMERFTSVQKSDIVTRLVNGMDIHPVAVEMARVNLERILPAPPTLGQQAFQIYLGDSLQTDTSHQRSVFGHSEHQMQVATPKGNSYTLPMSFVRRVTFANDMRDLVYSAVMDRPLPELLGMDLNAEDRRILEKCHSQLKGIIAEEGNSVWTWYTIHIAAPHLLTMRKVDRIVANPPWVRLSDIQVVNRKKSMEQYGNSLGLYAGGKQAPHTDIASYFILAARKLYMSKPDSDPACWLVKKSAIGSGQWKPFREKHQDTLRQSVDLESLQPFGGGDARRSCLLMENRALEVFSDSTDEKLEAEPLDSRNRPKFTDSLKTARSKFQFVKAASAFSKAPSAYFLHHERKPFIHQGATLVPRVLEFLDEIRGPDHEDRMWVITRRSDKDPWKNVQPMSGYIPSCWVLPVLTSVEMVAYQSAVRPVHAIIPVDSTGKLSRDPGTVCGFWNELDETYQVHAGIGKSTPKSLLAQIDFLSKLTNQLERDSSLPWLVLYPSSGDIMRAARIPTAREIIDYTLFWMAVRSREEAGYLVALLNSNCLQKAFKGSRESGRHFQLHPLRKVPIPYFDGTNRSHLRLAELCSKAEEIAQETTEELLSKKPKVGQVGLSKAIRNSLHSSNIGQEIERIAAELLPEQATSE